MVIVDSGTRRTLYSAFFVDERTGWLVGDNGSIPATATGGHRRPPAAAEGRLIDRPPRRAQHRRSAGTGLARARVLPDTPSSTT
jgi:hypothetical protein